MDVFQITGNVSARKRAQLGAVCVNFAILESHVEQVIWAIRGIDRKTGRPISSNWSLKRRLDTMVSDARKKQYSDKDIQTFQNLRLRIKNIAERRNWAVHGTWGKSARPGRRRNNYAISYKRKPTGEGVEMTDKYFNDLYREIRGMIHALDQIIKLKIGFVP